MLAVILERVQQASFLERAIIRKTEKRGGERKNPEILRREEERTGEKGRSGRREKREKRKKERRNEKEKGD